MDRKYLQESRKESISYINLILENLKKNLIESSKKSDDEIFVELLLFFRDEAIKSLHASNFVYTQIINIPADIYPHLSNTHKKKLIEIFTIRFTENISIIEYYEKYDVKFLEITYWALIKLIKKIIDENDNEIFNLLFNEIDSHIQSYNKRDELSYYNYCFSFTILSWLFYLTENDRIDLTSYNIKYLEEIFLENLYDQKEKIINFFYRFQNDVEKKSLFEIENWEMYKPPVGKAYFALMSHTWLNFSFSVFLLKYDVLNYGFDINNIVTNIKFRNEINIVKENIKKIETNLNKWAPIIINNLDSATTIEEKFNIKKEKIIQFYSELKKREEILYYSNISKIPISEKKVNEFISNVGNLWDNNVIIPTILKFYNRVDYKENIEEIKGYGFFQSLLKMRFAFIDGDLHQSVIGLTEFGSRIANSVDQNFFTELLKLKGESQSTNIRNDVDSFISKVKDKSKLVIFSNWRGNDILNDNVNNIKYVNNSEIPFSNTIYKDIPVINNFAFPSLLFIVDLNFISYIIYQKDTWYNEELLIEITEPTTEHIIEELEKNSEIKWSEKDGVSYTKEEIETLERNAIYLKVIFKFELEILEKNAFEIFKVIS